MKQQLMTQATTSFQLAMALIAFIVCPTIALSQTPLIDITPLTGETFQGEIVTLDSESLTINREGEETVVPRTGILTIGIAGREETIDSQEPHYQLSLSDGSQLSVKTLSYDGTTFNAQTTMLGNISGKGSLIRHVRYAQGEPSTLQKWSEILKRESKQDLLVINKEDTIDFVEGIISKLDDKAVYFLLDGEEIPVGIAKIFGIVLSRTTPETQAIGQLHLTNDDILPLASLAYGDNHLTAKTVSGIEVTTTLDQTQLIDFRLGRLAYLSELEPRSYEYTPFFDEDWQMRRDQNFDGRTIRIGSETYSRGLCIHSKTLVSYRLAGEYRRFQATMGIEELVGNKGNALVTIKADDDVLFEGEVKGSDSPRPLDFDISGKRDLEILVDFGSDLGIADHLALGDARLVK